MMRFPDSAFEELCEIAQAADSRMVQVPLSSLGRLLNWVRELTEADDRHYRSELDPPRDV